MNGLVVEGEEKGIKEIKPMINRKGEENL